MDFPTFIVPWRPMLSVIRRYKSITNNCKSWLQFADSGGLLGKRDFTAVIQDFFFFFFWELVRRYGAEWERVRVNKKSKHGGFGD